MKKLFLLQALLLSFVALAATQEIDGITWKYEIADGKAIIGSRTGSWLNYTRAIDAATAGEITIPSFIGEHPVVEIGVCAFRKCQAITAITIPSSVTNIADYAFYECSGLTSINMQNGIKRIGYSALSSLPVLTKITLPETVESLGDNIFEYSGIKSITLPKLITSIPTYAFYSCWQLHEVVCKGNITNIADQAFYNMSMKLLYFEGDEPEFVSQNAFCSMDSEFQILTSTNSTWKTTIPGTWIKYPISYASDVTVSSDIEDGLRFIGSVDVTLTSQKYATILYTTDGSDPRTSMTRTNALGNVTFTLGLSSEPGECIVVKYCASTSYGSESNIKSFTIKKRQSEGGPFNAMSSDITWEYSVTNGEAYVDSCNRKSGSIKFPDEIGGCRVVAMPANFFRDCIDIDSITLPSGLREIGNNAFRECVGLKTISIPSSVTNIGYFAFRDCLALWHVIFEGSMPHKKLGAFMNVPAFSVTSGRIGYATALVYAAATNNSAEIDVPQSWLDSLSVKYEAPAGYDSYESAFVAKYGNDFKSALTAETGKRDLHGNVLQVWQDYVAGTNPLNEDDTFYATVTIENGIAKVKWHPELSAAETQLRKYCTYGAKVLDDKWVDISALTDQERHDQGYQFFKVTVEMK